MSKANQEIPTRAQLLEENKRLRARLEKAEQTLKTIYDPRREQMEQALRESEERAKKQAAELDSIVSSLPDAITIYDKNGRIIRTNKLSDEFVSYPEADKAKPISERNPNLQVLDMHGKPIEPADRPTQRALNGEMVRGEILQIIREANDPIWISTSAAPIYRDGALTGAVAIVTDITRLRQTEEALRESEERFRLALKNAPISVATQDRDLLFQWAFNQRTVPVSQILGKSDHDLFPWEDAEHLIALKRSVLETGQEVREKLWITSGGKRVFLDLLLEPMRDINGNISGVGIATIDLTQTKLVEEALEAARAEAEKRKNRLEAILDVLPVGTAILDVEGGTVSSNREFDAVWGGPIPSTRQVSDYAAYKAWWMDSGKLVQAEEWAAAQTLATGKSVVGQTMRIERFDGTEAFVLNSAAPIFDPDGSISGCAVAIQNISERMQAEKELQRLNRTLRALSNINQAMMRSTDEAGFMEEVCQIVVNDCGHAMTWIGLAEQDEGKTVRPVASAGFEKGYLETLKISWADTERGRGPTGTAIRTGQVSMCRNMLTDPKFKPWREEALKRGYASSIVLPLMSEGKAFGAFTIYSREPNAFIEGEVMLLDELAGDLAYGITMIRTRNAHTQAQEALRQSEERFRQLADASFEGLVIHADDVMLDVNARLTDMLGYDPAELIGKPFWGYIEPKYHDLVKEFVSKASETAYEVELIHKDSRRVPVEVVGRPLEWKGRQARVSALRDVTERRQAETALRQSEEQYRSLFNTMIEGFCIIEVLFDADEHPIDYRFLEINPAFEKQTGLHGAKGKLMRELAPDHEAFWFETYGKIALTGEAMRFENEATALNRWFEVFAYRVGGPESRRVAVLFNDITERKKVDESIQTTLQRFYTILSSMYTGLLLVTDEGRVEFANQAFCDYFKLKQSPAALVGFTVAEILARIGPAYLHPDEALARIREIVDAGQPVKGEEVAMRGGHELLRDFIPIHINGKSYGRLWHHTDITDRKEMEEALRASEENYRLLLQYAPTAIYEIDYQGPRFKSVNDAMCNLTGYSREELLALNPFDLLDEQSQKNFQQRIRKILAGETVDNDVEYKVVIKDGSQLIVNLNIKLTYKDGKNVGAQVVGHDITERIRKEAELQAANEELTRFNRNMTGRELRMIELKKEVNALCERAGQPPHYSLDFEKEGQ